VTPSGEGVRIWGIADGEPLNRKFRLEIDGKTIAAELFRCTNKALTITGYTLDPAIRELGNINNVIKWGLVWGERRKAAAAEQATSSKGNGLESGGFRYSIEEVEQIVREGPPAGANRSDVFHAIVGHYVGCGWDLKRILAHLEQHPEGIGSRYLAEGRLGDEIARSAGKYAQTELPLGGNGGWTAKAPPEPEEPPQPDQPPEDESEDPELDDDHDDDLGEELPKHDPNLPRLYAHGDPDARPIKSWLIKGLIPALGHGLLSGQWGAGKTFVFFDLAASLSTGQPWLGHVVKRQCGVLLIAAEGADEVRLRLDAVVREKCGNMTRAPFRWFETAPLLMQKDAVKTLIAMARQAEASLQAEFGLPLGLIGIDTIATCAGYSRAGDEYDNAVGQAVMNVLKAIAQALNCFVLGVDHFGKSKEAGTRGTAVKEDASDVVWACLGDKALNGNVTNVAFVERITRPHFEGLPAVTLHCSTHSYRNSTTDEWRKLLGVSSYRHQKLRAFEVIKLKADQPVVRGFPEKWQDFPDELYEIVKFWPNCVPLAKGLGDPDQIEDEEEVGFAGEARVDGALGEPRLVRDEIERRSVIAAPQKHPARRVEKPAAGRFALFIAAETRSHTAGTKIPLVSASM
jgi:hypothetical protein